MSGVRCGRRHCGEVMAPGTDGNGRVVFRCHGCARNRRGLCRDCPARKAPRSMRCLACRRTRHLELARRRDRERYPARRSQVLAHHKTWAARSDINARRVEYMRAYRERNPPDDQSRAYQRVYMRLRRQDPGYRADQNRRKRLSRERQRLARELSRPTQERAA